MSQASITIHRQRYPHMASRGVTILSLLVLIMCAVYGFLIVGTTFISGQVRMTDRQMAEMTTRIAQLEVEYFTRASSITSDDVAELHMVSPDDTATRYLVLEPRATHVAMRTR